MLAQAAGFAILAAISPTALIVMTVFLGSASPRETATAYAAGAFIMTMLMAVIVLLLIRVTGLDQPRQHDPRYGLRLALGVIALATGAFLTLRRRQPGGQPLAEADAEPSTGSGLMSRLVSHPSPRTAFVAGLILFAPGATFIAAVQVVASAQSRTSVTVVGIIVVVVLSALTAWLPLVMYLVAPQATEQRLGALNAWLRLRGRLLLLGALNVAGIALVINGILGLAHVI